MTTRHIFIALAVFGATFWTIFAIKTNLLWPVAISSIVGMCLVIFLFNNIKK